MARRIYGNAGDTVLTEESVQVAEAPIQAPEHLEPKPKRSIDYRKLKYIGIVAVVVIAFLGTILTYYNIRYVVYDNGFGYDSPEALAVSYLGSFGSNEPVPEEAPFGDRLMTYIPRKLRSGGYGADNVHMNDFSKYASAYNIRFDNIQMVGNEPVNLQEQIPVMESGIQSVYGKSVHISEAQCLNLLATIHYTIDDTEYNQQLELSIPCIRCDTSKWYLYTGTPLSASEPISLVSNRPSVETPTEPTPTETPSIQQRQDVDRPIPDVEPYDEALQDLLSGRCVINGVECTMPMFYSEAMEVGFDLDESALADADRLLQPNYILQRLPVTFKSSDYDYMDCRFDVGNNTDDTTDISNCLVTTLYLGKPSDAASDYFDVILPGNVTFGTSYDDVCAVYGSEYLFCIKGQTNEPLIQAPSTEPPVIERTNYNTWTVTVDGETFTMTEEEKNAFEAEWQADLVFQQRMYEDYLRFLEGSEESSIVLHSSTTRVYRVEISDYNYIYLGFENSKLVSIQWYYFDITSYRAIGGNENND